MTSQEENTILDNFYDLLWEEPALQDIFFRHRDEILSREQMRYGKRDFSFYQPRIVISNYLENQMKDKKLRRRIKASQRGHENFLSDLGSIFEEHLEESALQKVISQNIWKAGKRVISILESSRYVKAKMLREFLLSLSSERRLTRFLHKQGFIETDNLNLDQLGDELVDGLLGGVEKSVKQVDRQRFSLFIEIVDRLSETYMDHTYKGLIAANQQYINVLYDTDGYRDRLELFDELYDVQALMGGKSKTFFECVNCPPGTFKGTAALDTKPSRVKISCPNCEQDSFFLAPYHIAPPILQDIMDEDGLLLYAIVHLIEDIGINYGIRHRPDFQGCEDVESDIILLDPNGLIFGIIEIKMFKTSKPQENLKSSLMGAYNKFMKAREKYIAADPNFGGIPFYLVSNISDKQILDKVRSKIKKEQKGAPVFLYPPNEVKSQLERLAQVLGKDEA